MKTQNPKPKTQTNHNPQNLKRFGHWVLGIAVFIAASFLFSNFAYAQVCPLCVVAAGAGLGLSRWLGVDDILSSIWIGALLMALVLWTIHWLRKKNWNFKFNEPVVFIVFYASVFIPLYYIGIAGHHLNKIFGIDKIIFGSAAGIIIFSASLRLHGYLKAKNNGKVFFPYQRVVVPVAILILFSLIFYLLLTWKAI